MAAVSSHRWNTIVSTIVAVASLSAVVADAASADGKSRRTPVPQPVAAASVGHQSILRIGERDRLPSARSIQLGRGKSMLIELPVDLRDVVVSNPEVMDAMVQSADRVYLIGKKTGQSNAFFFDVNGSPILTLEVTIENDVAPLELLLRRLIPGSDIRAEMMNDTIIMTGTVRSPADANRANDLAARFAGDKLKVINMIAVDGEEQVMLKVVVAEVQREALKQFGVNLGAVINSGSFGTAILSDNALPLTAAAGLGMLQAFGISTDSSSSASCSAGSLCNIGNVTSYPGAKAVGNSGADTTGQIGPARISGALRALERAGLIRTLAEPNLTAVSGESAKFLAGGGYPIPVSSKDGQIGVTFKEFGVSVAFTPIVLSEGRISLKIETEVSELSNSGAVSIGGLTIPALRKRTAKSTVELPSGGSLAMAGLLSDDVRQNIDGFPGLKNVPVLGTLFRSRDYIKRESELVVIVTPYTVRPTAPSKLAMPNSGLQPASDFKAILLGHFNRIYGRDVAVPAGSLKDIGFIVE